MNNNLNNNQPVNQNIPQSNVQNNPQAQPQAINRVSQIQVPPASNGVNLQPQVQTQIVNSSPTQVPKQKKSHGKTFLIIILFLIIIGLGFYIYTDYQKDLATKCSPLVQNTKEKKNLDLNSTIVQDLYNKVKTTVREDVASNELNDKMKLYLAFRQIPESKIYDSNCNLFDNAIMQSVTCEKSLEFSPRAFKEETLKLELKKLFGEDTNIENANIQLGNSCFGGYQYIAERGEYVEGYCKEVNTTLYNVDKKLIEATVFNDTITLKEKVRYYSSEGINTERLKNGTYVYTFKLDNNYNYAYISKTIE